MSAAVYRHALELLRSKGIGASKVLYVDAEGQDDEIWFVNEAGLRMHVWLMTTKNPTGHGYTVKATKPKLGLPL